MSKQKFAPAQLNPAQVAVKELWGGPLKTSMNNILSPTSQNEYAQNSLRQLTQNVRGGYGARGLAGSGIAQKGETEAANNFMLDFGNKGQDRAIEILKAGSSGVSSQTPIEGRGFMGLK